MPDVVIVKIEGLGKIERKLRSKLFTDAGKAEITQKLATRMRRGGKGIGARRNPIAAESRGFNVGLSLDAAQPAHDWQIMDPI